MFSMSTYGICVNAFENPHPPHNQLLYIDGQPKK